MGSISLVHLILLAIIVLLFFGPSRLPQLGQSLAKTIKGFKNGLSGVDESYVKIAQIEENQDIVKQSTRDKSENKS